MAALIGAANNMWHPPAVSLLSNLYPERRGFALSIHATGASLGDMSGPLAAGILLLSLSWQGTAMVSSLPALALALVFWLGVLPRDPETAAGSAGSRSGTYLQGLWRLMRRRMVLGLCGVAALRAMVQTGLTVFLPLYLADVMHVSPVLVGGTVMAMHLGGALLSPVAGHLGDRFGPRPVVMAGLTATTFIIAALTFIRVPLFYVGAVSLLGFVLYSVRPVMLAWLMNLAPAELRGSATSLMFGAQSALAVLMPLLGGLVADRYSLVEVFYLIAGIMLLANVVLVLLPRDEVSPDGASPDPAPPP
jgi:MFS family permease